MAAVGRGELAADRAEYRFHFGTEPDEDGDGHHGDEGENQGVLDERLALPFSAMILHSSHGCHIEPSKANLSFIYLVRLRNVAALFNCTRRN